MKPFFTRYLLMMATLMVSIIPLSLVGCGEPTGEEFSPPDLQVVVAVPPGLCDGDTLAAFCAKSMVNAQVDLGDLTPPYDKEQELKLADDGLGLSATFDDLPATAGHKFDVALTLDVDLPAGYEIRQSNGTAFTGDVKVFGDSGEATQVVSLKIVAGAEIPQGSGVGAFCINVVDAMNMAVDTQDCEYFWITQSVSTATPPDGVTCDNVYLGNLSVGTAELKVVCGELQGSLPTAKVAEDETTDITVVVSKPIAQPSGKGDLCVSLTDSNGGNVDESTCTFTVDGVPVIPDVDAAMLCDGALFVDQPAKLVTVKAVCEGGLSGSLSTQIVDDTLTSVGVTVSSAPPDFTVGDVCIHGQDKNGADLTGCTFDWQQLADDPMVSANPPANCSGNGDYWFTDVPVGAYDVTMTCGQNKGEGQVDILGNAVEFISITALAPVANGDLCVTQNGIPIDLNQSSVDLALYLGYGVGGLCQPVSVAQAANLTVTAWKATSGGQCVDKNDPTCTITVQGLVVSVPDWSGYGPNEQKIFDLTVEDTNAKTAHVFADTLNGYFVQAFWVDKTSGLPIM